MRFKCKECWGSLFEEVLINCIVVRKIFKIINKDGIPNIYYDINNEIECGIVEKYQCRSCGAPVVDSFGNLITKEFELVALFDEDK